MSECFHQVMVPSPDQQLSPLGSSAVGGYRGEEMGETQSDSGPQRWCDLVLRVVQHTVPSVESVFLYFLFLVIFGSLLSVVLFPPERWHP